MFLYSVAYNSIVLASMNSPCEITFNNSSCQTMQNIIQHGMVKDFDKLFNGERAVTGQLYYQWLAKCSG